MKFSEMFPAPHLRPPDLGEDGVRTMTIDGVEKETIEGDDVYFIYFRCERKGRRLNKTNGRVLSWLYSDETEDWAGQRIQLYVVPVQNPRGDTVDGIRLRAPKPDRDAERRGRRAADDPPPVERPRRPAPARQAPPEPDDRDGEEPW
jgi:hypothetical protein